MRLEGFICELLYEHDCVVLPGFGGLVANYRSARLNRLTHLISPPSKHIGFNRNLRNNDGLLANHISQTLGITYDEAIGKMDNIISGYQQELLAENRLMLEKIGVFFKDKSGQLQFMPEDQENFLLSSYGLGPVQLKFVGEEMSKEETPIVPIQDERRKISAWKIAAAIVIPILFAGSMLLRNQIKEEGRINLASLNPFHEVKIPSAYLPEEFSFGTVDVKSNSSLAEILSSANSNVKFDFVLDRVSETGIEIENIKIESATPVSTEVKSETSPIREMIKGSDESAKYAVIGGAFKVAENAQNFVKKLQADGFDASFAGTRDGLQLVAYGFYSSKSEASRAMKNIKNSGGHAWIKRN